MNKKLFNSRESALEQGFEDIFKGVKQNLLYTKGALLNGVFKEALFKGLLKDSFSNFKLYA